MVTLPRLTARLTIVASLAGLLAAARDANGPSGPKSLAGSQSLTASKSFAANVPRLAASPAPFLGTASSFAILGGAGVTCDASTVTGDVGSKLTVTHTPTCTINGGIHQGDATAVTAFTQAFTDPGNPYDALKTRPCPTANNLTGQPLGGQTLRPGVYCFNTTADLTTGTLTLTGPANGIWVFQIGSGITTGTASVVMAGGGQPCNVFWRLGSGATIGTETAFQGNILAGSAITFTGANSSLVGRALAKTAVTMTGTTISGTCKAGAPGGGRNEGDNGGEKEHGDRDKHRARDKQDGHGERDQQGERDQHGEHGQQGEREQHGERDQHGGRVNLRSAATYGILAGSTVTCVTGGTIHADVGVSPGSGLSGFPPCTITGATHLADATAARAQGDLTTAYNQLAGMACGTTISADLGGTTIAPGVYCAASSVGLTGTVTVDAQGNANALFVIQAGSTLTTGTNASVNLMGGAQARNVWWQVGSSTTLGTGTAFKGNILALTSITLVDNATLTGRALARNGAVTLSTGNTITVP